MTPKELNKIISLNFTLIKPFVYSITGIQKVSILSYDSSMINSSIFPKAINFGSLELEKVDWFMLRMEKSSKGYHERLKNDINYLIEISTQFKYKKYKRILK